MIQRLILTTPTGNAVGVGDAEEMLATPAAATIEYKKKEVTDVRCTIIKNPIPSPSDPSDWMFRIN